MVGALSVGEDWPCSLIALLHAPSCSSINYNKLCNRSPLALQGEMFDGGLFEIFQHEFGLPGARRFEAARRAFLESTAAYSIASYILWAKDRHNGNLMLDNQGHFLHIDFGYILGISPGGWVGGWVAGSGRGGAKAVRLDDC